MNKSTLIIIVSLLVNIVIMVAVSPVYGQTAKLYVDPPSIIDTTKTAGTDFTIDINVKDIIDFFGYNIKLIYNTTLLNVNTVTLGTFFPSGSVPWHEEINDTAGYIWYALTMPYGSQYGVDGSGTLMTISFTVESIGETILDLDTLEIFNHKMKEIPRNVYDGYFSNILRHTRLQVDPEKKIDPDLVLGKNFTINVNILNATDLFGFDFFLNYTTAVLSATNITLGSSLPSGSVPWHEEINDTAGYVWYNVTMPVRMDGNGILATITFTVESIGETTLGLSNTKLVDSGGRLIEHDTGDGYFSNEPIIHDIVITDVTTTVTTVEVEDDIPFPVSRPVSEVYVGEKVNVTVFVKNNGTILENFNVTAYYNVTRIGTPMNVTLSKGFVTSLVFEWNTEGVEVGNYTIWAEASGVVGETIEDQLNNKFTMKGGFKVLRGRSLPVELVVVAVASVFIIAVTAVYLIKFRKPKPVAKAH